MTYNTKVYQKQGGDELVVADGGKITVETGGTIETPEGEVTALLAILAAIPTTDPEVEGQVWNDEGVLKASAGPS